MLLDVKSIRSGVNPRDTSFFVGTRYFDEKYRPQDHRQDLETEAMYEEDSVAVEPRAPSTAARTTTTIMTVGPAAL